MKRLMIAATLLLAATSMSVWAQAPAANDPHHPAQTSAPAPALSTPPAAMPTGPTASDNVKSGEGIMTTQQMMHDMKHGQRPAANQHDHDHNGRKCCELSKADKPQ